MPDAPYVEQAVGYDKYQYERTRRLLSRIRYKKGYQLRALPNGNVFISTFVTDVVDPRVKVQIGWNVSFSSHMDFPDDIIIQQIYRGIVEMECHEASEWFTVDGKAIYNEHDLRPEKFR